MGSICAQSHSVAVGLAGAMCLLAFIAQAAGIADRVSIHTDDGKLPASFAAENLNTPLACLRGAPGAPKCNAWMMDVTDDGVPDVIIMDESIVWVFSEKPAGKWIAIGQWSMTGACDKLLDAMRKGQFQAVTPIRPRWPDLDIGGQRFAFAETRTAPAACP